MGNVNIVAIGISPEKLEFNLKKNETVSRSIFLQNLNPEDQTVQIKAAKYEKFIRINPEETSLPPKQIVPVEITIQGKKDFETELQISTLTQGNNLAIQSGIKIPLKVEVENSLNYYYLIFGILVLSIAAVIFYKKSFRT